jgi:CBS domain-containing protein
MTDTVAEVAKRIEEMSAKDIMTGSVLSVSVGWSIQRLADFFISSSISGAPVLSLDNELVGVVTLSDLVRYQSLSDNEKHEVNSSNYYSDILGREYSPEDIEALDIDADVVYTVGDIMTSSIFDVSIDDSLIKVAHEMREHRVHRVFVINNDGQLQGVISALDLLKVFG